MRNSRRRVRSFNDDAAQYGHMVWNGRGLQVVPIAKIVGSVGRARELRPDFMPAHRQTGDERYHSILNALSQGDILPPVNLYKLGDDYYVLDGNHRVAAARTLGQLDIDAVVVEFALPGDRSVQRQQTSQRRTGLRASLRRTTPIRMPRGVVALARS